MAKLSKMFFLCVILSIPTGASAQLETALTIGAVVNGLQEVLKSFNTTISTAGNEIRSTGTSLTTNGQNLLTDLNSQFGGRLQESINTLSGAQRQLIDDALLLTRQVDTATQAAVTLTGDQARMTIADADITAYNASYSLPCRSLTPRVVYVTPTSLRRGNGAAEIRVRGNFLDLGELPVVKVDGKPAALISRARNDMVIAIPPEVMEAVGEPRSVPISIEVEEARRTNVLISCYSRNVKLSAPLMPTVQLRPALAYTVSGTINGVYDQFENWSKSFNYQRIDGDCAASFDDTQQFCAPAGYSLAPGNFSALRVNSTMGNSRVASPQIAGDRCVTVVAHLGGNGYDVVGPFKSCKGRGFFDYDVVVNARKATPVAIAEHPFKFPASNGSQKSFQVAHPSAATNLPNATWQYSVMVEVKEGDKTVRTISAGHGNPNPPGVVTRTANGIVYVSIND